MVGFSVALVILAPVLAVQAQIAPNIPGLPRCAVVCADTSASVTGCLPATAACLCAPGTSWLSATIRCANFVCGTPQFAATQKALDDFCLAVPVPPTSPPATTSDTTIFTTITSTPLTTPSSTLPLSTPTPTPTPSPPVLPAPSDTPDSTVVVVQTITAVPSNAALSSHQSFLGASSGLKTMVITSFAGLALGVFAIL